ncbi:Lipase, GDSL [Corchorus capsularis]|uniref:Lipase, GDSL n=1 Tax=Corchorus capsularis TaxID=210143 RepID=A0A1R3JJJ0_COCAP|nr:Lipase, GDSL [Corchorus capsularis]
MAIYGVGTLGLIPITLAACGNNASCTAELNRISALFNDKLKPVIQQLNTNLTDAKFTYLNPAPTEADIAASGFTILGEPCCQIGGGSGELCVRNSRPCNNRTQYIFWDGAHPTEAWNNLTAGIAFRSQSPSDADPFNIQELAQQ